MPNLANLTLVGHLGRDVETKFLPSGDAIAEFSVATTLKRKAGDVTTWWRCTAFGKTAEIAAQYLSKGDACMVIGTAYNEPWSDKDGANRLTLKVQVDRIVLLGKRAESEPATRAAPAAPKAAKPAEAQSGGGSFEDMSDDIPFISNMDTHLFGLVTVPSNIRRANDARKTVLQMLEGASAF